VNKKIVIFGGGTISHVRNHLALCAPAYGNTALDLKNLASELFPNLDVDLQLTKMAGGCNLETNEDIEKELERVIEDPLTKVVIMSCALCDFRGHIDVRGKNYEFTGKYGNRLSSKSSYTMELTPADKLISKIRAKRKDIFLVGFKTTCGASEDEQYIAGLNLCKGSSCNLVLANDTKTRLNMVITPEEARYHVTTDRDEALRGLMEMVYYRSHLTFTQSTVVAGEPISWDSPLIPSSLRTIVDYCINQGAYKPFNGVTVGHFACKVDENTFLTSIRKTNFNDLSKVGMVKIVTDGPDTVLAYGAKPSVGGQSQRIIFKDHPNYDCVVHFHCPIKPNSKVNAVSQREVECGSHECGKNTSNGLRQFGNLSAVFLDNHGPNIVFNRNIDPQEVTDFISENFELSEKTGGYVTLQNGMTPTVFDFAKENL
jgi:hypothetical protein